MKHGDLRRIATYVTAPSLAAHARRALGQPSAAPGPAGTPGRCPRARARGQRRRRRRAGSFWRPTLNLTPLQRRRSWAARGCSTCWRTQRACRSRWCCRPARAWRAAGRCPSCRRCGRTARLPPSPLRQHSRSGCAAVRDVRWRPGRPPARAPGVSTCSHLSCSVGKP